MGITGAECVTAKRVGKDPSATYRLVSAKCQDAMPTDDVSKVNVTVNGAGRELSANCVSTACFDYLKYIMI